MATRARPEARLAVCSRRAAQMRPDRRFVICLSALDGKPVLKKRRCLLSCRGEIDAADVEKRHTAASSELLPAAARKLARPPRSRSLTGVQTLGYLIQIWKQTELNNTTKDYRLNSAKMKQRYAGETIRKKKINSR